jgi:hypothetical protein
VNVKKRIAVESWAMSCAMLCPELKVLTNHNKNQEP